VLNKTDRDLFPSNDTKDIKKRFHELAKRYHSDLNHSPDAALILQHIIAMKDKALNRGVRPMEEFERIDGTKFRMSYREHYRGANIDIYTGDSHVSYVARGQEIQCRHADQHKWRYASTRMEEEMSRFIAPLTHRIDLRDGIMYIYRRLPDQILMSELIRKEGAIPPEHVAWMISKMLNLACYLEWLKISHTGFGPDFLWVNLEQHEVGFMGPLIWWEGFNHRPIAVPARTVRVANWLTVKSEKADHRIDLSLVRETAKELLGVTDMALVHTVQGITADMARWLKAPAEKSAVKAYEAWELSRGKRVFVKYPKNVSEIIA
jgi:hypothetical protein